MTGCDLRPSFIKGGAGRILAVLRAPDKPVGCVLFVPAFAEEMNKSRRQVTETAHELARSGYASLIVDLSRTGDSDGEFVDASWNAWQRDITSALTWAAAEGLPVSALVATRLGCALAAASLREAGHAVNKSIFWQPIANGSKSMTQFLRLRVAASMMGDDAKETVESLKARLAAGESLEVAGYELSPELWQQIEDVKLADEMDGTLGSLSVLEISRIGMAELSTAGRQLIDKAAIKGIPATGQRVTGDPFWSATEIVTSPELTALSVDLITQSARQ